MALNEEVIEVANVIRNNKVLVSLLILPVLESNDRFKYLLVQEPGRKQIKSFDFFFDAKLAGDMWLDGYAEGFDAAKSEQTE